MGRIAEFSEEDIINAGKSIQKGGPVSVYSIRNKLNGGDSKRIKKVWNNYLANNPSEKEIEDIKPIDLPTEIIDELNKNSDEIKSRLERLSINGYAVAQKIAEKRVESTIVDYKSKINEFEESERQASIAIESCDRQILELNNDLESLLKKNEDLVAENANVTGILSSAKITIAKLEGKESEFDKLKQEYGKLLGKYEIMNERKSSS